MRTQGNPSQPSAESAPKPRGWRKVMRALGIFTTAALAYNAAPWVDFLIVDDDIKFPDHCQDIDWDVPADAEPSNFDTYIAARALDSGNNESSDDDEFVEIDGGNDNVTYTDDKSSQNGALAAIKQKYQLIRFGVQDLLALTETAIDIKAIPVHDRGVSQNTGLEVVVRIDPEHDHNSGDITAGHINQIVDTMLMSNVQASDPALQPVIDCMQERLGPGEISLLDGEELNIYLGDDGLCFAGPAIVPDDSNFDCSAEGATLTINPRIIPGMLSANEHWIAVTSSSLHVIAHELLHFLVRALGVESGLHQDEALVRALTGEMVPGVEAGSTLHGVGSN